MLNKKGVLLLISALLIVGACWTVLNKTPDIVVDQRVFQDIIDTAEKNQVAAKEKYSGKWVEISGRVTQARQDGKHVIAINFEMPNKDNWIIEFEGQKDIFQSMSYDEKPLYYGEVLTFRGKFLVENIYYMPSRKVIVFRDDWEYVKPKYTPSLPRDKQLILTDAVLQDIAKAQRDNRFQALADYKGLQSRIVGQIKTIGDTEVMLLVEGKYTTMCKNIPKDQKLKILRDQTVTVRGKLESYGGELVAKDNIIVLTDCSIE